MQLAFTKKATLCIATMFRVLPWVIMKDRRKLDTLVGIALGDAKRFTEEKNIASLLRITTQAWLMCTNIRINPAVIERVIQEVMRQAQKECNEMYDDNLGGRPV